VLRPLVGEVLRPVGRRAELLVRLEHLPEIVGVEERPELERGEPVGHGGEAVAARGDRVDAVPVGAERLDVLPHRGAGEAELVGDGLPRHELVPRLGQEGEDELLRVLRLRRHPAPSLSPARS
jgi:hypothetical protein